MGESGKPNQLPKEAQIMYQRIPDVLRCELDAMPPDKRIRVLEALITRRAEFHGFTRG